MRGTIRALALAAGALLVAAAPAAAKPPACDPWNAHFRGEVPTSEQVIGIELGERDVTTEESDRYVRAVAAASPRVVSGALERRSVQGRELVYAVAGRPGNVREQGLERIRRAAAVLMDPRTSAREAERIARQWPAILWIAGNVHGGEESGTDASLRVLYELADRNDCAAKRILDEAIVVILPIQNPDGRELDTRRNAYGFDMNRDWFARTQPETDAKVEMLRRLPGPLFIDAHEMGSAGYFFPPNADPIYHEITDQSVHWINDVYGAAMQREFDARGIPYFNHARYDLFYMGYGDTVPATGFLSAGMTFEKNNADPTPRRVLEQYLTQWTSLNAAAANKERILREWHRAWVEAVAQGREGRLEPNEVVQPENEVQRQVPDLRVRHYFLRADDPAKAREVQELVRRLQRMDVEVYRLGADLTVPDFTPYGRAARSVRLPRGTYWIPMAQRQKHWVQAMLHEDPYTPFPYFYDVTAWSQPLLFDVEGGYSGRVLDPAASPVRELPEAGWPAPPASQPAIAILQVSQTSTLSIESSGWLRFLLDEWGVEHRTITPADVRAGALAGADVVVLPDGSVSTGANALGPEGAQALRAWVSAGGRLVAWSGGGALAARLGISSAQFSFADDEGLAVPGTLFRVRADEESPLTAGVGRFVYAYHLGNYVMRQPAAAKVVLRYPEASSEDFFASGYAEGEEALAGTAALSDERVGQGRAVVFGFEPNFRAFTDGTQRILRAALLGPDPAALAAHDAGAQATVARRLPALDAQMRLVVGARGERAARRLLAGHGARYEVRRRDGRVAFLIANPGAKAAEEHPYARQLASELDRADVPVVMFRVP